MNAWIEIKNDHFPNKSASYWHEVDANGRPTGVRELRLRITVKDKAPIISVFKFKIAKKYKEKNGETY